MFNRTLNGADMINATSLNLPPNENAVRINGDFGTAGQVLAKDENNKLNWSRVDEVEIPDGSIGGEKLKTDIDIDTSGDIIADNITARELLKANTILELPNTTTALKIGNSIGSGLAGQVLAKNNTTNKLEWDYVDDITIEDRSIAGVKLIEKTITDAEIADNAVITRTINDGAITNSKIADGTIENGKIKDGTIENGKIKDGTIENGKIKDGTIENGKIKDGTIENGKIKEGTIENSKIKDNTIENGKLKDLTIEGNKIKGQTIEGGKLADDITIDTSGNIIAEVITAKDHFVQTTENGAVENTFTGKLTTSEDVQGADIIATGIFNQTGTATNTLGGGITTTGSIEAYEITATHRYIQTGAQLNTFAGGLTTSKGYLQTNGADINVFAGQTFLEKAGNPSAPSILADGGYALQVGDGSTDADVYIKRNLVVDGTIHGNIQGDIIDNHIDCQSLVVEDKGDAGATGITVKDNYDILMKKNEAGSESNTIMLDSSTGDITSFTGNIVIDGQTGKFKGFDNSGTKSQIEDVDFSSTTLVDVVENRVGRTFTKRWMPALQYPSGAQVNWTYSAGIVPSQNWHDFSGEVNNAGTMEPRHLLDITNVEIRTTKIKARISINMACNYQFGIRLSWRTGRGTIGDPYSAWSTEESYLCFGDDWITQPDGDDEGFLGRGQWKWDFPVMTTVQNVYYSFMPEVFIAYNTEYGSPTSAVQFWVGSSTGNAAPTEDTNSDLPAIFEVIEIPSHLFQESTAAGTYPPDSDDEY